MAKFPLNLQDNVLLLNVSLRSKNTIRTIKMVLDTGASITTIPHETALAIGIDPALSRKKIEVITASATVYVPVVIVPKLIFLGFSLENVDVLCLDLPPSHARASGLLGLNVLKNFNISLRFKSKIMEITR